MDFRRMTYFVQVAELGSLSKVADRLRIAQPALSRQIRLLEAEVGVPLFERHRRGMQLTAAGEKLRQHIIGPLRQLDQAVEAVRSLRTELSGHIAFGMLPTVSHVLAGPLARRMAQQTPRVSLRIIEGYGGHLIDWLQRGEIDAAILYGPAANLTLKASDLLSEELVLVGPPDCDLTPQQAVYFRDLADLPLVLPSRPHGLRMVVDAVAGKMKAPLNVRFQADSFTLMKDLVEAGLGYTILPLSAFGREAAAERLRYAPIAKPKVTRQLSLAAQPGGLPIRAAEQLEMLVRQEIAILVREGHWPAATASQL
jgi:DNA-binding transcriptional LysR family regulator